MFYRFLRVFLVLVVVVVGAIFALDSVVFVVVVAGLPVVAGAAIVAFVTVFVLVEDDLRVVAGFLADVVASFFYRFCVASWFRVSCRPPLPDRTRSHLDSRAS